MKPPMLALLLAMPCATAEAQLLSNSDREALIERLEGIREEASSTVDARYRSAIAAYRGAMNNPNDAFEFYLKCEQLLNFDAMQKRYGDFREWKKKNHEKFGDTSFREAQRQQIRWLVLTLEAASTEPDRERLATEAAKMVDSIVSSADKFSKHHDLLREGVTSSIFARAYNIGEVEVDEWPLSILPISAVYEQVIFPPLRRSDRLDSLKSAWSKRLSQELSLTEKWSAPPGENAKAGERSPAVEKFVTETLPVLRWEAEVDLFTHGDEKGAALRMLELINKNLAHRDAPKWIDNLTSILQGKPEEGEEAEDPKSTESDP